MKHRVVAITGASAGVGRAASAAFAREGAAVGLVARGEERLESARREVEELGVRALTVSADVADHEAVDDAAARIEAELGPIDVWVNNAMATVFAPFSRYRGRRSSAARPRSRTSARSGARWRRCGGCARATAA